MKIPFLSREFHPNSKWKTSPHLTSTISEGEIAVVDSQEGKIYHFNGIGAEVWRKISASENPETIAVQIAERFDAPVKKVRKDVFKFILQLRDQDLIELVGNHE